MKAEERHRLQENDLRRLTEHARERTRPFFDRYGTTLLLALAAVLVIAAVGIWWSKTRGADQSESWSALAAAFRQPDVTAKHFRDVADNYPGTKAAVWARLYEGESHLDSGIQSLFSDREGAARDLEDARAAFDAVLEETATLDEEDRPELTVRALYGLARTLEASSDGDLEPAVERYQQIVEQYPETIYKDLAQERIDALKSPEAKSFYAWFSQAKPTVRDPLSRPQDRGVAPPRPQPGGTGPVLPGTSETPATGETDTAPATPAEAPKPAAATDEPTTPPTTDEAEAGEAAADAAPAEP
ncbi:MAG TPA: tetratricopeptide repeat protein, partial [Planctomycetaceae bacterium]